MCTSRGDWPHAPTRRRCWSTCSAIRSVLAAWLSGSGPTVAALVPAVIDTSSSVAGLPPAGRTRRLAVSPDGVRVLNP